MGDFETNSWSLGVQSQPDSPKLPPSITLGGSFGDLKDYLPKKKAALKPGDESLCEGGVRARLKAVSVPAGDSPGILQDSSEHLSFLTQLLARSQANRSSGCSQVDKNEGEVELSELNTSSESPTMIEKVPLMSCDADDFHEEGQSLQSLSSRTPIISWLRCITCRCWF
mmetsp:Transcript_33339/g.74739  ORF Transcript_33339/g.74739 Transcript_33339/m.74739 type:complete len:169 (-) Transcript_33339:107-613(-)